MNKSNDKKRLLNYTCNQNKPKQEYFLGRLILVGFFGGFGVICSGVVLGGSERGEKRCETKEWNGGHRES
jgi:hypothetical protein